MKKGSVILVHIAILFLSLISVGVASASDSSSSQYASAKVWRIGDIYDVNGVKGIVFALSSDRQHGQILSLTHTIDDWDDAEAWCCTLGEGWILPSKLDLEKLHLVFNKVNEVLAREGYDQVETAYYWTRECSGDYNAYVSYVCDKFASEGCYNRYNNNCYVRAVRKF